MIILAIDPGTATSGWVMWDQINPPTGSPDQPNEGFLRWLAELPPVIHGHPWLTVCEMPQYYGKDRSVGMDIFETCYWVGNFRWAVAGRGLPFHRLRRPAVRAHICGTAQSNDRLVRQALIDRFGGDSVALKGKKCGKCKGAGTYLARLSFHSGSKGSYPATCPNCEGSGWLRKPGPLAGITSHMWAALAVAVTWAETQGGVAKPAPVELPPMPPGRTLSGPRRDRYPGETFDKEGS